MTIEIKGHTISKLKNLFLSIVEILGASPHTAIELNHQENACDEARGKC